MTELRRHTAMETPLFKAAAEIVKDCDTLMDIGCGIRPQNMVRCKRHICVEPHGEYAEILKKNHYEVIQKKALEALDEFEFVDTIFALDVIEHMEREDGEAFLKKAVSKAKSQVVVFTPLGFMPQEETGETDAWGLHGQEFQRHRSGWVPDDFPGWKLFVRTKGKAYGEFIAVHTA